MFVGRFCRHDQCQQNICAAAVAGVEVEEHLEGQALLGEVAQRLQGELEALSVESEELSEDMPSPPARCGRIAPNRPPYQ